MRVIGGRVVKTPDSGHPYKVVLQHDGGTPDSEYPVSTVREGELLISERSPSLPAPERMREHQAQPRRSPTKIPARTPSDK